MLPRLLWGSCGAIGAPYNLASKLDCLAAGEPQARALTMRPQHALVAGPGLDGSIDTADACAARMLSSLSSLTPRVPAARAGFRSALTEAATGCFQQRAQMPRREAGERFLRGGCVWVYVCVVGWLVGDERGFRFSHVEELRWWRVVVG